MANDATGYLVVRRVNSWTRDVFRAYQVWVDQAKAAEVRRGGTARIPLRPGQHRIQIRIDWCASPELSVEVAADAETALACGPNRTGTGPLNQVLDDPLNYVWLREN